MTFPLPNTRVFNSFKLSASPTPSNSFLPLPRKLWQIHY